jgi:hypothetical protein
MQVFKGQGVDVVMGAEEVSITYRKEALLTLQNRLGAK